ncbi:MAG: DUF1501 domain-containing protein [Planctomycetaceae bacterium]|nr:DUF1501 domain-containing protein [Planctomycetaceae bacterium]
MDRRRFLSTSGMAGLGLTRSSLWVHAGDQATRRVRPASRRSVILLWMAGGPSQIDTWDPKPLRPVENRGPFSTIASAVSGIRLAEHLPLQAAMLDRFTIVRSFDAAGSDHSPGRVMQTGNPLASPRRNAAGALYPAMGSVVAKFRGPNQPGLPAYVAFNRDPNHVPGGGYIGMQYDPMNGHRAAGLPDYEGFGRLMGQDAEASEALRFTLPDGVSLDRLDRRRKLLGGLDRVTSGIDPTGTMKAIGHFQQEAVDMIVGGRARDAFDLSQEPEQVREKYGRQLWCQQALIARRLVESGVSFVTVDLTMGINAGDWDSHGDQHVFGGISTGLKPLLPVFDHLITTLVSDLEERGLLDDVLILALGEFGRSPVMGTQKGFTGGRNHWPRVMSMCLAGGGLNHGRVVGSSDQSGGEIHSQPVTPFDLAATVYRHMEIPPETTYEDTSGRPRLIVEGNGRPIGEIG